jgi:hypothetical protein
MLHDLAYSVTAYVVGYIAFALAFVFAFGIEGGTNALPYYAALGLLLGLLLGRWWLLPMPALHWYVVDPFRWQVLDRRHLPAVYAFDRLSWVLVVTIAIAVGVVVRQGMRERASSAAGQCSPDVSDGR